MPSLQQARFFISVDRLVDLPPESGAEIAFAGRSNAGKSSAINTLTNQNRLAFVSKTPGRTQLINYFDLGDNCFLVDLPGYGYAKVPETMRVHWQTLLSRYLQTRENLRGLMLMMDVRHPLTGLDRQMIEWFTTTGKPVHILLTKADKLSKNALSGVLREVRAELQKSYPLCSAQAFSSLKRTGVDEAKQVIDGWLADGAKAPEQ